MSSYGILNAFVRSLREPRAFSCSFSRSFLFAALLALTTGLAACGGGGGSSNGGSSSSASSGASGSSGDIASLPAGPQQQPIAATAANTVAVTVNRGITGNMPNIPTVSVTICVPSTGT